MQTIENKKQMACAAKSEPPVVEDGWLRCHFVRCASGIGKQRQKMFFKQLKAQEKIEFDMYHGDRWVRPLQITDEKTESP